jgi:hypothetical protein
MLKTAQYPLSQPEYRTHKHISSRSVRLLPTFIEFCLEMRLVASKIDIWTLRYYEWIFLIIWVAG